MYIGSGVDAGQCSKGNGCSSLISFKRCLATATTTARPMLTNVVEWSAYEEVCASLWYSFSYLLHSGWF